MRVKHDSVAWRFFSVLVYKKFTHAIVTRFFFFLSERRPRTGPCSGTSYAIPKRLLVVLYQWFIVQSMGHFRKFFTATGHYLIPHRPLSITSHVRMRGHTVNNVVNHFEPFESSLKPLYPTLTERTPRTTLYRLWGRLSSQFLRIYSCYLEGKKSKWHFSSVLMPLSRSQHSKNICAVHYQNLLIFTSISDAIF